ncbi:putative secreted protein [Granulibacter bethesdensis]|uniref:Secreted protein n=2 Tax=Granulibacter bethesdensis TaxID=364410 RepID=Q0BQV1_GRABC|nr:putative secreted protein [Granulibacter bethesdensis CGDNIH1]AHJ68249.1 putative secreted protein [Granulibacter bethesdensis]APH52664.1 putative secreted protein [Granulibacter bethesdensis]APH65354.1 putative secreted protein [Granulibacter bethesdensis]
MRPNGSVTAQIGTSATIRRRILMTLRYTGPAIACMALALSACQKPPEAPSKPAYIYEADTVGAAPSCSAQDVTLTPGKESAITMTVQNDGGWCAAKVTEPDRTPYTAGLLIARPAHGKVVVHSVGYDTRTDYTPDPGYQGADSYVVQLLPGDAILRVNVTVTPGKTNITPAVTAPKPAKATAAHKRSSKKR